MNAIEHEFTPEEQRQLDLLVDGELPEAARRQLLCAFDERPGAWRRCALAFLEAQSFAREIQRLLPDEASARAPRNSALPAPSAELPPAASTDNPARGTVVPASTRGWWHSPYAGLPLATAASFLVAFGVAWYLRHPRAAEPAAQQAAVPPHIIAAMADPQFAANAVAQAAAGSGDAGEPIDNRAAPEGLTLVVDDRLSGREREIQLPVVEATSPRDLWRDLEQPAVSPAIRDAFERLGHRVEEHRQFVPVNLRNGRQAIVPVDDLEFLPVSARAYQ